MTGALAEVTPEYTSTMIKVSGEVEVDTTGEAGSDIFNSPVAVVVLWEFDTSDSSTTYNIGVANIGNLYYSGLQTGAASGVTPLLKTPSDLIPAYGIFLDCKYDPTFCVGTLKFVLVGCGCPEYLPITVSECTYNDMASATPAECTDETPPTSAPSGGACFPESVSVHVQDRGKVAMKDLQIGDLVFANGKYQPVYAFGHHKPDETTLFLQLHTEEETPLELSPEHLVFLDGNDFPVPAHSIQVGDVLQEIGRAHV